MNFTFAEYADMQMVFGVCEGNANACPAEYSRRFPARRQPSRHVFTRLDRRLRETGRVLPIRRDTGRPRTRRTPNQEQAILNAVAEDPRCSTRGIARLFNINSNKTVHQVLKDDHQYPYRFRKVQPLLPADYRQRVNFCNWLLSRIEEQPDFHNNILYTDEATFTRDGVFNSHNLHEWAHENPHNKKPFGHQHRFSLNVWLGIIGTRIVGPHFLPNRLNAENYLHFLNEILPVLLEDVTLNIRRNLIYQHDGAPAHYSRQVRRWLNDNYHQQWIGRGSPLVEWAPRSPDLNVLDFFAWGFIKNVVYQTPLETIRELEQRIRNAVQQITPQMLQNVQNSIPLKATACTEENGGHFEHLL